MFSAQEDLLPVFTSPSRWNLWCKKTMRDLSCNIEQFSFSITMGAFCHTFACSLSDDFEFDRDIISAHDYTLSLSVYNWPHSSKQVFGIVIAIDFMNKMIVALAIPKHQNVAFSRFQVIAVVFMLTSCRGWISEHMYNPWFWWQSIHVQLFPCLASSENHITVLLISCVCEFYYLVLCDQSPRLAHIDLIAPSISCPSN